MTIWLNLKYTEKWYSLRLLMFIVVIGGPICAAVIIMHNSYVEKKLAKKSIHVVGTVTELFVRSGKSSQTPYLIFTYKVHQKTWKQILVNKNRSLKVGDRLNLICSDEDPEIFKKLPDSTISYY